MIEFGNVRRLCCRCKRSLPREETHVQSSFSRKDGSRGFQYICRPCKKEKMRAYRGKKTVKLSNGVEVVSEGDF